MESVSVRVMFWRCFHSLFCVSPSPLKLFLLNVFAIAQSSGCFAGGGQTVCCPPSSLVGCAPAVPICQMNYGYGSYGGGGSYAAPLIVNYPRPFGYQQQTQFYDCGGSECGGECLSGAECCACSCRGGGGAGAVQVGAGGCQGGECQGSGCQQQQGASRIEVLEEGAKEAYAKDVEDATGAWEAEDAREEEIIRA
ncbi:hypothetical protein niasHT_015481 [Heterodera trifolii]|uniref:Uncharacterized protein n=1 Tax=Heterodera trifolii TaxID=157864 RepID=A0ABD2L0F6_9BILA